MFWRGRARLPIENPDLSGSDALIVPKEGGGKEEEKDRLFLRSIGQ